MSRRINRNNKYTSGTVGVKTAEKLLLEKKKREQKREENKLDK